MTREELINTLEFLELDDMPNVEIYILDQPTSTDNGIDLNIYKTRLHQDLPEEIQDTFYPKIRRLLVRQEYDLINYNPAVNPDRKVIWQYDSETVPFFNIVKEKLVDIDELEYYNSDVLAYEDIWAIWIKLRINETNFYLIQKVTPRKVLSQGSILSVVFTNDNFRKLESDVLTIDGSFDVFACEDFLIFNNKQNFEQALLYQTIKQEVADDALGDIEETGLIENFEELKDFLKDDYHSINKLNKIKGKPYFQNLTFNNCCQIIRNYGVDVEIDEANNKLNIQSKKQAKQFIKVLNDDYLMSEMTNNKYAANSKEDV